MDAFALKSRMNSILPGVDIDKGLRLSVNNVESYKKALYCALKSIRFKLPLLDSMIESGEYEGLRVITHTLGQLLTNIGADGIAKRGYELECTVLNAPPSVLLEETIAYRNELAYFLEALEEAIRMLDTHSSVLKRHQVYSPEETRQLLKEAFPTRSKKIG